MDFVFDFSPSHCRRYLANVSNVIHHVQLVRQLRGLLSGQSELPPGPLEDPPVSGEHEEERQAVLFRLLQGDTHPPIRWVSGGA